MDLTGAPQMLHVPSFLFVTLTPRQSVTMDHPSRGTAVAALPLPSALAPPANARRSLSRLAKLLVWFTHTADCRPPCSVPGCPGLSYQKRYPGTFSYPLCYILALETVLRNGSSPGSTSGSPCSPAESLLRSVAPHFLICFLSYTLLSVST